MALTPAQQEAATTLDKPLFIQAGAGTGKTHTLVHRLVYAFSPESNAKGKPVLENASQFVTITFTNKAAGELLGRIRAALRNNDLEEAALEVDSAWISTIHSMCKRILVEHALDTGIDATAELIDESQQKYYLELALERFHNAHACDTRLQELIEDYTYAQVFELIKSFVQPALMEQEGFSHIEFGPEALKDPYDASSLFMPLQEKVEDVLARAQAVVEGGSKAKGPSNLVEYCETILGEIGEVERDTASAYAFACEIKPKSFLGKDISDAAEDLWDALASFISDCMFAKQRLDVESFVGYAKEVVEDYSSFKNKHSLMDTDELLARAFALLDGNPAIAQEYQDNFKLVMIDEFQDTDRLQTGIIENLVPDDMSTLATVGDRQQSIYGFRGTDVTVFNEQQNRMDAIEGRSIDLDSNFRSHDEILKFVDSIFSQEKVFGDGFLSLKHGRKEEELYVAEGVSRVRLLMAGSEVVEGKRAGTRLEELRHDKARMISEQFAKLRDVHGCKPGGMIILLRNLTNVHIYLDALRSQGFKACVSGGTVFYRSPEVHILINYLKALANPYDGPAIQAVLMSPLYNLSDAELLTVSGNEQPYDGLMHAQLSSVKRAAEQFKLALLRSDQMSTAELLQTEIELSGWTRALSEQGSEGTMVLANIEKFISLVGEYEEKNGVGLVGVACYFDDFLKLMDKGMSLKENPGVLQEESSDAVQLMTVHASKGLEFPIVAVAEFEDKKPREGKCYIAQDRDGMYPSIKVYPESGAQGDKNKWGTYYRERLFHIGDKVDSPSKARTAGELYSFVRRDASEREIAESKRLFYVACTRAREVLIVATNTNKLPLLEDESYETREGLLGDIETAFFDTGFPSELESFESSFTFGTGASQYEGAYVFNVHENEDVACTEEADGQSGNAQNAPEASKYDENEEPANYLPRIGDGPQTAPVIDRSLLTCPRIETAKIQIPARLQSYSSMATDLKANEEESLSVCSDNDNEVYHTADVAQNTIGEAPIAGNKDGEWTLLHGIPTKDATVFGSAFHLMAERWLLNKFESVEDEAERAVQIFDLDHGDKERLLQAFDAWSSSERARELRHYPLAYAEYPFVVPVEGSVPLQGAIDALGIDKAHKKALICDYKTGTSGEGEPEVLRERYLLQATCYAYAVFKSFGEDEIEEVELAFVRPESKGDKGMEEVVYSFSRKDVKDLGTIVRE